MSGRILVVDDIATNRVILRSKLAAAYYEVIQAENGREALEKAFAELPDVILLDILMPDLDGFAVCKTLKSDPRTTHIPVIIVTALQGTADRLRGLAAGADDFLTKPINDLALFSRVRNLLRSKFMMDELHLRDRTSRELGLSERPLKPPLGDTPPAQVALLPTDAKMGQNWLNMLADHPGFHAQICPDEGTAIRLAEDADAAPDVFLIHARQGKFGDGLRLVSYLRSRPKARNTAVVLAVPDGDLDLAAKGLDLGAHDYVFDSFDPAELTIRLRGQVRRKRMSDQLRSSVDSTMRLAVTDPLTGLYNRRYATQHLARIAERARKNGKGFALMLLDIDNFKSVNDRHGHNGGDSVLAEFARRIQENLRGVDLISRIGGEEFLVAMPDTTEDQARSASERLRREIEQTPFQLPAGGATLNITVSIGVTLGNPDSAIVDTLIEEADKALYTSKHDGRNMVTVYSHAA